MGSTTTIPVEQYLRTSYHPDCDYVEGEVVERNMGEQQHATLQSFFVGLFWGNRDAWQLRALPEQRVQVKAERFRIPDVCVVSRSASRDAILYDPPLLCIEILSSDDSLRTLQQRVQDYADMGVANIWVVDPWNRVAYYASAKGYLQPTDGHLRLPETEIAVSLEEMFRELEIA